MDRVEQQYEDSRTQLYLAEMKQGIILTLLKSSTSRALPVHKAKRPWARH